MIVSQMLSPWKPSEPKPFTSKTSFLPLLEPAKALEGTWLIDHACAWRGSYFGNPSLKMLDAHSRLLVSLHPLFPHFPSL